MEAPFAVREGALSSGVQGGEADGSCEGRGRLTKSTSRLQPPVAMRGSLSAVVLSHRHKGLEEQEQVVKSSCWKSERRLKGSYLVLPCGSSTAAQS